MVNDNKIHTLKADNLERIYHDENQKVVVALQNFNLEVKSGEIVALVGPSGCGKSTFLRCVAGLDKIQNGSLTYDGVEISGTSNERGFVFQSNNLFPWLTVTKNIAFPLKANKTYKAQKHRVQEMIDIMGLTGFEKSYPHQISGGMASRVALAQTFISDPKLILLDEPLSALDAFTRSKIQDEILKTWAKDKPMILLVTHDIEEAIYMSTRVVVVSHRPGKVISNVEIDLPFPRNRIAPEFIEKRSLVMEMLGKELVAQDEED